MEWHPIETAPRDNDTPILCRIRHDEMFVLTYDSAFKSPWRVVNEFGFDENVPTHWQPLPPPPTQEPSP